jgi:hypothetical protein
MRQYESHLFCRYARRRFEGWRGLAQDARILGDERNGFPSLVWGRKSPTPAIGACIKKPMMSYNASLR